MAHALTSDKFLAPTQYDQLYGYCHKNRKDRNALLFLTLMLTGARIGEVLSLSHSNLTSTNANADITIVGSKGSNSRTIPIPIWLHDGLMKLPKEKLFEIGYARAQQLWKQYTPAPDKPLHSLRHTFALRLYQTSKDIRLVQYSLGHKNIDNTLIYVNYSYSQNELRKAFAL